MTAVTAKARRDAIHEANASNPWNVGRRADLTPADDTATTREVGTTEAALILGVHRSTVLRRAKAGKIQARRIGLYWRIAVPRPGGLTALEEAALRFEINMMRGTVRRDGREYQLAREQVGTSYTTTCQIVARLLDDPRALAFDAAAVMMLRRLRDARTERRLPRRRLADHPLPARADTREIA